MLEAELSKNGRTAIVVCLTVPFPVSTIVKFSMFVGFCFVGY
jgi:hypothetical protein